MIGWWDNVEVPVRDLAQRLARKAGLDPDGRCLPYEPQIHRFSIGTMMCIIHERDLMPVWATLIGTAREALATRDDQNVDAAVGDQPEVVTFAGNDLHTFTDDNPDAAWRKETGLDGEDQE